MRHSFALMQAMKAATLKDGGHLTVPREQPVFQSRAMTVARAYALSITEPPLDHKAEDFALPPPMKPKYRKRRRPGRERR